MPSLNRAFRPEYPEGRADHLSEGFIMGCIPATIVNIDDPEKLGRVQCNFPLIDPTLKLPNDEDAWIWVLESFTLNNLAGGTHSLLEVGLQVALLPMFGDPRFMFLIGCIPNRVDPPHPFTNRAEGTYGSVTRNEVYDIKNDFNQSRIQSYPHGVMISVTSTGHIIHQTQDAARTILKQDGNLLVQNPYAGMHLDPYNKGGRIFRATASGSTEDFKDEIELINTYDGRLQLLATQSALIPPTDTATRVENIAQLHAAFGEALLSLAKVPRNTIAEPTDWTDLEDPMQSLSAKVGYDDGREAAQQFADMPLEDYTNAIAPQTDAAINNDIPDLSQQFSTTAANPDISNNQLADQVIAKASERQLSINNDEVQDISNTLRYNPDKFGLSAASQFLPNGYSSIDSLANMGVLGNLSGINRALNTKSAIAQTDDNLYNKVRSYFPEDKQEFLTDDAIAYSLTTKNPTATLLATIQKGQINNLVQAFNDADSFIKALPTVTTAISAFKNKDYVGLYNAVIDLSDDPNFGMLADLPLGDGTIRDVGKVSINSLTIAELLGDRNPGTLDLTKIPITSLIINYPKVDLTPFGVPQTISSERLLSGVRLGTVDLSTLNNNIPANIDLNKVTSLQVFGGKTVADMKNLDMGKGELGAIVGNAFLPSIAVNQLLIQSSPSLRRITLGEFYGDHALTTALSDIFAVTNMGQISLSKITFLQLL